MLIVNRTCDLTDDFSDIYENYWPQVKAVGEMDESNWTFTDSPIQPHGDSKWANLVLACSNFTTLIIFTSNFHCHYLWKMYRFSNYTFLICSSRTSDGILNY